MTERIVITGIGVVSPFGVGRDRFWQYVSGGCSGTRAITEFDASDFACRVAAPVTGVTIDDVPALEGDDLWDPGYRADPKRYSRAALIGVIAAREAWADAGLRIAEPNAGVVIGSGGGGIDVGERQYYDFFAEHGKRVSPYAIPVSIVGMVSSEISISLRLRGVSHVLSCGCTSSSDAIGYAAALLRAGDADVILSGGTDACVTPGMIFGFSRMKAVSVAYNERPAEASRPFDKGRDGFVLGEGAWMIALEREDRARARGARIYASIDGYASTCDAYHRVQMAPDGEEIVRAIALAIERSGRRREEIGYVNYHGTSTVLNDAVESRCVRQVFGGHAERLAGSSVKSMVGHSQGASGAAGVVTAALALSKGFLPPTINQHDPDPACDLDVIPNQGRRAEVGAALCNCLGFGSKNSALVIGRA
ncbi:MAG TPA: beta-ketoacyl-[acyl-carrier-protein] synthase family protein [Vicinamibacterales bacterium]|jgi:3-oxoacyl-[acyl-carrier-protein] synthase II|nr:beta-ketoacyl-[acyl-carrier-protein] synthase family protein [Vicinamibacterales bacterium]